MSNSCNRNSGKYLVPPSAQELEHASGVVVVTRLAQNFGIDHHNCVCAQYQTLLQLCNYGLGLGTRETLDVGGGILQRCARLVDAGYHCLVGPTYSAEYVCAARATRGEDQFFQTWVTLYQPGSHQIGPQLAVLDC